jgi:hypothetical protein
MPTATVAKGIRLMNNNTFNAVSNAILELAQTPEAEAFLQVATGTVGTLVAKTALQAITKTPVGMGIVGVAAVSALAVAVYKSSKAQPEVE